MTSGPCQCTIFDGGTRGETRSPRRLMDTDARSADTRTSCGTAAASCADLIGDALPRNPYLRAALVAVGPLGARRRRRPGGGRRPRTRARHRPPERTGRGRVRHRPLSHDGRPGPARPPRPRDAGFTVEAPLLRRWSPGSGARDEVTLGQSGERTGHVAAVGAGAPAQAARIPGRGRGRRCGPGRCGGQRRAARRSTPLVADPPAACPSGWGGRPGQAAGAGRSGVTARVPGGPPSA